MTHCNGHTPSPHPPNTPTACQTRQAQGRTTSMGCDDVLLQFGAQAYLARWDEEVARFAAAQAHRAAYTAWPQARYQLGLFCHTTHQHPMGSTPPSLCTTHSAPYRGKAAPSARAYAVQPSWRLLMQDVGIMPAQVLRAAQLPQDLLTRRGASLSPVQYFALWTAMQAQAPDDGGLPLPLRIAQALSADWFDPVLFSALCSADLQSALGRVAKYKRLICPMQLTLTRTPEHTTLGLRWTVPDMAPPPVLVAVELVFFVQLARMATRHRVRPLQVYSPLALEPAQAYQAFFEAPCSHGPEAQLVFSAADAQRPFLTVNPGLWTFFEPSLRLRLAELDAQTGMTERLRNTLLESLPAGEASLSSVARKMGVSARTLQRRLNDEGTSFQRTLDDVRRQLAQHYLTQSGMSGAEIAFLLGFEDPNSFSRAFQNWTGQHAQTLRQSKPN